MTAPSKRHATVRAIVNGSSLYNKSAEFAQVDAELEEVSKVGRVQPERRKRLLQGLHSTRALDTCTGIVLSLHGVSPDRSLGPRLTQLKNLPAAARGHLSHATIDTLRKSICSKRNDYVHKANMYPKSSQEVDSLVADVETFLSAIM